MKTAELTGALLDYYVARAEGVPAEQCTLQAGYLERVTPCPINGFESVVNVWPLRYSTDWAQGGPLIEKYSITVDATFAIWAADVGDTSASGDTPLQAICRAVVRATFGDEVEDLPC